MYEAKQQRELVSRSISQRKQKNNAYSFFGDMSDRTAIQRKVIKAEGSFFSSYDPENVFRTSHEAALYDSFLRGKRPPTLYTYTHTEGENVNTWGIPQGPHTLGYAAIEKALGRAMKKQGLDTIFAEQCLPPDVWLEKVKEKLPESVPENLQLRINRAYERYVILWETAKRCMDDGNAQLFRFCISSMIQLSPMSTYVWETTKKAPRAALKGKGENDDIEDDRNIDTLGIVRGEYDAEDYLYWKRQLMDGDYKEEDFEEEDFEEEEFEEEPEDIEDLIDDEDIEIMEFQTIEDEFNIGEVSGEGNLCLINTIVELLDSVDVKVNKEDLVQYLREIGVPIGNMLDFLTVNITENIAANFNVRFQIHVVALNGRVCNYPVIGNGGPVLHLLHRGAHFSPLFPK